MKECYWCKKSCPDEEEGSFELDPKDENIEVGWICNHCIVAYLGLCDCEVCMMSDPSEPVPSPEEIRRRLKEYNLAGSKKKMIKKYNREYMSLPARILSYILG